MADRIFTDEELREMGMSTLTRLTNAIKSGNKNDATDLADQMYKEFEYIHDLYVDWTASFMDYIYRTGGIEALYQALHQVVGTPPRPSPDKQPGEKQSHDPEAMFQNQVKYLAGVLRGHLQPLTIEEDDEKVCITMETCGSGQRLKECGAYGPPRNLTVISEAHPITWGMTGFPVYCTHAPMLEILSIEAIGYPGTVIFPADEVADKSCRYCIYKDPETIPEAVFQRVGKQKPSTF